MVAERYYFVNVRARADVDESVPQAERLKLPESS